MQGYDDMFFRVPTVMEILQISGSMNVFKDLSRHNLITFSIVKGKSWKLLCSAWQESAHCQHNLYKIILKKSYSAITND